MINALSRFRLLLSALSFTCLCYAAASAVQFPNEGTSAISPNGKYIVNSIENTSGRTNHVLILEDSSSSKKWPFYEYDRHVEVLWSPKGDRLIINDHAESNQSTCILYDVSHRTMENLWKIIENSGIEKSALSNDHVYVSCARWLADDRVEVALSAYGDANPEGIDKVGNYQVGSNQIKLKVVKKGK